MPEVFADRLLAAVESKGAAVCVGLDPMYEMLPDAVAGEPAARDPKNIEACIDAVLEFGTALLRVVAPLVPVVKLQSAWFEKYLWEGVETYYSLVQEAEELGLLVIGDVKRGDIGTTCAAYADGHLADPPFDELGSVVVPDAITVNPFCGLDTLGPFLNTARDYGKGLFVLVRTSNPGSAELQDAVLDDGRTWSEMLADRLAVLAEQQGLIGDSGFSSVGAVVGATQPHTMQSLRRRLPKSFFLLPGYGAQGATAEMTRAAFVNGQGALVSASRSVIYAHRDPRYSHLSDWKQAVQQAVIDMKADVNRVVSGG